MELSSLIGRLSQESTSYCRDYVLKDGILYREYNNKFLFIMPKSIRKSLVVVAHDLSGHPAVEKIISNILQDFWFVKMRKYMHQYIRMCYEYLMVKRPRERQPRKLHPIPIGKRPFDIVHLDHVGPFSTTSSGRMYM